jgi:lipid-binding SYLF domain-containing protein
MMRDSRGFRMTGHGKAFCIAMFTALALLAGNAPGRAADAREINAGVNATLDRFYRQIPGAREVSARATGVLVFPTIIKAGFGVGGEYGEGAMRVGGKTVGYYTSLHYN